MASIRIKIVGDISPGELGKFLDSVQKCLERTETAITGEPPKQKWTVKIEIVPDDPKYVRPGTHTIQQPFG